MYSLGYPHYFFSVNITMGKVRKSATSGVRQYHSGQSHPNFIQHAIHHPGAFTAYCKRNGFSGPNTSCVAKGRASNG